MTNAERHDVEITKIMDDYAMLREEYPLCQLSELQYGLSGECVHGLDCKACLLDVAGWLCAEEDPSILRNGDSLEYLDTILVRDKTSEEWRDVRFGIYFDDYFWCYEPKLLNSKSPLYPYVQAKRKDGTHERKEH